MTERASDIVKFDNVGLRYGADQEVLSDLSFTLFPGRFYFLTGASGAGKTSLLKLLYLAQRPSRGGIRMFGRDMITLPRADLPHFRRRLGVVFQDFRLVDHLSAFDNVALPLRLAGTDEERVHKSVSDMLDWVNLTHRADASPQTLSGGEQQRVAIARAIAPRPDLIFADEPTGNLDVHTGEEIVDLLFARRAETGATLLIITHDPELAEKCERVLTMADGVIASDRPGANPYKAGQ